MYFPDPNLGIRTNEGPAAVQEAIDYLEGKSSVAVFSWSDLYARAAKAHVEDIGPKGLLQFTSSAGENLSARLRKLT